MIGAALGGTGADGFDFPGAMTSPAPLTRVPSIVVISDRVDRRGAEPRAIAWADLPADERPWCGAQSSAPDVTGGYLERLPLACVASGIVEQAEIWHHQTGGGRTPYAPVDMRLGYRGFRLDDDAAPFDNHDMVDFVRAFGAPHILVVYGLGVSTALLDACARSVVIYNSIDAPTLRVPTHVSARFDLVLTGAPWQSAEVEARHPGMATAVLPVGPEFAAIDLFRPLGTPKDYDLIYVAAAQGYKRHDILLDAFAALPREVRGLCLFGYGEDAEDLRRQIAERELSIDCIGPPGVAFDAVNALMNRARFGVVCGRDDGAPAILTEYMLAGLPVLANAELACGTQYILPETGMLAAPHAFAEAILAMRERAGEFRPREAVLERWIWPHTIARFRPLLEAARANKPG